MRVLVVGAGVTGLTVGVTLAEAGFDVHLFARELPLETTSAVAAALWYPYRVSPAERVLAWSARSLEVFTRLAGQEPECGVSLREGDELLTEPSEEPAWSTLVTGFRRLAELPAEYRDGWTFEAPVVEMSRYLRWLQRRLETAGGTLTRMAFSALPDRADLVVNCSGLGARGLSGDAGVSPVRGQVVRLAQVGVERWLLDPNGLTYVVPRSQDIIVGGTDVVGEWDRRPDLAVAEQMLARACRLVPALSSAAVLGHRVGLRPARDEVRLEASTSTGGRPLIHCYGHGGAGVTVSWGCGEEVLALAAQVLRGSPLPALASGPGGT